MILNLVISAIVVTGASGLADFLFPRSRFGRKLTVGLMVLGSLAGLSAALTGALFPDPPSRVFPWPAEGKSLIGLDALSAFFLVPIFLVGGLGSLYGAGYWPRSRYPKSGGRLGLFWGFLTAGMALLVTARHALSFLLGWEIMALSAFFLIIIEDEHRECRKAGLIYLIATHAGTLTLFGLFAFWRWTTGSFVLEPAAGTMSRGALSVMFLLALFGFGMKAGMMPLHFWLPGAHANAPSHVSAMLSGVVLKMGIYGLVRFFYLFPAAPAMYGGLILLLGTASALLGVAFAIAQHDIKKLLAYHSVENIGIILMGLGLAVMGRSFGRTDLAALGLAGCLLHTWNHGIFKSLLFFGAGSVVHETGTRSIDRLGGLGRVMPWTAAMFFVGAAAICALPPLNGFVSELFIYLGLMKTMGGGAGAAVVAAPVLAMVGALAVACFVKVYGTVFLGNPRSDEARNAHEPPFSMRLPMALLAVLCVAIGAGPLVFSTIIDAAISAWTRTSNLKNPGIAAVSPLGMIGAAAPVLAVLAILAAVALRPAGSSRKPAGTWDCGYARPSGRMQYTASSFAAGIVGMFGRVLRPSMHLPHISEMFPAAAKMSSHVDDAVLQRIIVPVSRAAEKKFEWFHRFQRGMTQSYILYILIFVIFMFATLIPFKEIFSHFFIL